MSSRPGGLTISQDTSFLSTDSSVCVSDAPTPYNTVLYPESGDANPKSQGGTEEVMTDHHDGDTSFRLSTHDSISQLLPTPSYSSVESDSSIPFSTRPIPAPPVSVRFKSDSTGLSLSSTNNDPFSTPLGADDSVKSLGSDLEAPVLNDSRGNLSRPQNQQDVDAVRLRQLGYDAVLGRDYTFWSSLCISGVNIGCLQGVIYAVPGAYSYGGPLMILIAWPVSGIISLSLTLTLSELASAYPVSGAMASWAWKCARGGVGGERAWGWLMGGVVLGGHLGNVLLVTWQLCRIIQGTMAMSFEYEAKDWHLLLFFLAILMVCGVTGSTAWGRSHRFWLGTGVLYVAVWLVLNISLLTTVIRNTDRSISSHFYNDTGWSSKSYVGVLGWQYCTIASGADASAHMAEETQNPNRNVPNAMTVSMVGSYLLGYISVLLLLLTVKADEAAIIANHSFPVGHILQRAIDLPGAIAICTLLITVLVLQVLAQLQASSRFVFALARDNATPFAETIRYTNSAKQPVVANWVVIGLCAPGCLMTIAGERTLYSVLAVTASSLSYAGYTVPIILYLLSGKDLQTESRTSWSLRRLSKPVGWIGAAYGLAVMVTQMLPGTFPVTAQNISWSPVILAGTTLLCFATWRLYGDKHYSGPIRALTKWQTGVEIDLQSALASSRSRASNRSQILDPPHSDEHVPRPPLRRAEESDAFIKIDGTEGDLSSVVQETTMDGAGMTGDDPWTASGTRTRRTNVTRSPVLGRGGDV